MVLPLHTCWRTIQCLASFPGLRFGMKLRVSYVIWASPTLAELHCKDACVSVGLLAAKELSCYMVFFKYHWIHCLFEQWKDRYKWKKYMCGSPVCGVPCFSLLRGFSSTFTSTFPLWSHLSFTSSLSGRLQSLDWTSGLDWWTGLVDWP